MTEPYERAFTAANLKKDQEFCESSLRYSLRVNRPDGEEVRVLTLSPGESASRKLKALLADTAGLQEVVAVEWTHCHYIKDDEYIAFDPAGDPAQYIPAFLQHEIAKPIIARWFQWSAFPNRAAWTRV